MILLVTVTLFLWSVHLEFSSANRMGLYRYVLQNYHVNSSSLSITSFQFHPVRRHPEWVDAIIGREAVYWNVSRYDPTVKPGYVLRNDYLNFPGRERDIVTARRNFKRNGFSPPLRNRPMCSIELLGFVRIGSAAPFRGEIDRIQGPSMGWAWITESNGLLADRPMACSYRALYSNRREADRSDSFWAVIFYCPGDPQINFCDSFTKKYVPEEPEEPPPTVSLRLVMQLPGDNYWFADLHTIRIAASAESIRGSPLFAHNHLQLSEQEAQQAAENRTFVCTAWPYMTDKQSKLLANQAVIYEFLRYYSNLGMHIYAYDRNGANLKGVFESAYAKANAQRGVYADTISKHLFYHDYTIHSLLLPDRYTQKADMEQQGKSDLQTFQAVELFDNDKVLTYTHCRAQVQAQHGAVRVIVIDFDEFLYCKDARKSVRGQIEYLEHFFKQQRHVGADQIMFGKTTVADRATGVSAMQTCINEQIARNLDPQSRDVDLLFSTDDNVSSATASLNVSSQSDSIANERRIQQALQGPRGNGSIFNCFASINFIEDIPNVKSIALTRRCPFSSMHHSCAPHRSEFKAYDCICNSFESRSCDFVHLSLVEAKYGKSSEKFSSEEINRETSELWFIANADHY